jgi:triosephosphate isomerase
MKRTIFAANWKMHLGVRGAREFLEAFLETHEPRDDREVWFYPSAVALEAVADALGGLPGTAVGVQNVHWEPHGAFTGEVAVSMAKETGATTVLVGHSERRHVFGETDQETGWKVRAVLGAGLVPMLCVGETIAEREAGETLAVVGRQLGALEGMHGEELGQVVIAYEPVWAIGTGRTATPRDAAEVHRFIRAWLAERGVDPTAARILYGGSVKPSNILELIAESEIDGVLVGGASLDPASWQAITSAGIA